MPPARTSSKPAAKRRGKSAAKSRAKRSNPTWRPRLPVLEQRHLDLAGLGLVALGVFLAFPLYLGGDGGEAGQGLVDALTWAAGAPPRPPPLAGGPPGGPALVRPGAAPPRAVPAGGPPPGPFRPAAFWGGG